jgi:phosphotriesterase-related protein
MDNKAKGMVQTVLGLRHPSELGVTLTHEHLLIDLTCYFRMPEEATARAIVDKPITMEMLGSLRKHFYHSKDAQTMFDENLAIEEILKYKYAGGRSIVDTTSIGIARDPLALARISRATGLNIIMGGSYYVIDSHPEDMSHRTEDSLTEQIVKDVTIGVGDTGVKTGVIGEIGNYYPIRENETKILRASAQAQVETGAPILIHPGIHPDSPLQILKVLTDNGASADNIIFGHLDNIRPMSAIKELASSGCYLEYDRFGAEDTSFEYESGEVSTTSVSDAQRLESLDYLISEGLGSQITMAHDVCLKPETVKYGGRGFAHILESIIPRMLKRGISQQQIDAMLIDNPAKALKFK